MPLFRGRVNNVNLCRWGASLIAEDRLGLRVNLTHERLDLPGCAQYDVLIAQHSVNFLPTYGVDQHRLARLATRDLHT